MTIDSAYDMLDIAKLKSLLRVGTSIQVAVYELLDAEVSDKVGFAAIDNALLAAGERLRELKKSRKVR